MQLIGINNLIILNKLFAELAQLIRINNLLEYSLIRIIRVIIFILCLSVIEKKNFAKLYLSYQTKNNKQ